MKQLLDMNFAKLREKIGFDRWVLVMVLPPKGVQDSHGMSCFSLESKEFLSTLWCGWKQPLSWSCVIIEHIELIEWEHFNVPAECMERIDMWSELSRQTFRVTTSVASQLAHWTTEYRNFQILSRSMPCFSWWNGEAFRNLAFSPLRRTSDQHWVFEIGRSPSRMENAMEVIAVVAAKVQSLCPNFWETHQ